MSESFLVHFLNVQHDLRAFIGAMVRDPAAREDVFQEVSMTLWKSYAKFDPSRSFGAWARGVAARKILENHRYSSRLPECVTPEVLDSVAAAFAPEDDLWQQRERALKECIAQLPKHSGQLVSERYAEGLSMDQLSERRGLSVEALYQTLSRLRRQLRDCVTKRIDTLRP
jgi:RNA polymerase sigma-70 factor (ECF subfamily)